ncbi:MAG: ATP-binding protein [Planctomycetota bacterium]
MDKYIHRSLEPFLLKAIHQFPVVLLTGPRQAGKTTLLRNFLGSEFRYVSLDPMDVRAAAASDPRGFLEQNPPPVILDEVQNAPDLLPYIKQRVDEQRDIPGRYLLSGSQNLLVLERASETLAGRVAILRLFPLSLREILGRPGSGLPWETAGVPALRGPAHLDLWRLFLRGGYPELAARPDLDAALWHSSYVQTYLERDVRALRQVGDLGPFRDFLSILAARSGNLLNLTDVGRDLGIVANTIRAWLSILESTFQIIVLRPWFENVGRRLVKMPKVYLSDTGVLCHLAGLTDAAHSAAGPLSGAILETAVVGEVFRTILHRGETPRLHFWRTSTGLEVDLVVEAAGRLVPVEVKATSTPRPAMAAGIEAFRRDYAERVAPGFVIHSGDIRLPLVPGVEAVPFGQM